MTIIGTVLFWSVFATVLACMEIESEGRKGWAENAPTWYRVTPWYARAYGLVMGKKPLTGYHMFTFLMPALIFHAQFAMGLEWSVERELLALAMYFCVCPLWDYYWFVLNPWYRGKFTKLDIWWHAQSYWVLGRFPVDYLVGVTLSIGLAGSAAWWAADRSLLVSHLMTLLGFAVFTVLLHLASPLYRKWYWHMRLKGTDERKLVNIFHSPAPQEITKEMLVNTERIH